MRSTLGVVLSIVSVALLLVDPLVWAGRIGKDVS